MRKGRDAQLEQVLTFVAKLRESRFGRTVDELAEELGVHRRTVQRYIAGVSSTYFPLERITTDDGHNRLRFKLGTPPPGWFLSAEESLGLVRLQALTRALRDGFPVPSGVERLLKRLEGAVPTLNRPQADSLAARFGMARTSGGGKASPEVVRIVDGAVRDSKALVLRYRSAEGHRAERRFDPYILYVADGTTYTYGYDHLHREPRVLALDRVESASLTGARFQRPAGLTADSFVEGLYRGFVGAPALRVTLLARGRAARLLERPETADTEIERLEGGAVRVRFSAPDVPALRGRILSLGAEVVVETPSSLAEAIAQEANAIAAQYQKNDTSNVYEVRRARTMAAKTIAKTGAKEKNRTSREKM